MPLKQKDPIIVCPYGTEGDIIPLLALALELRKRGYPVIFATSINFREYITRHAVLNYVEMCGDTHKKAKAVSRSAFPAIHKILLLFFIRQGISEQCRVLSEIIEKQKPQAIISNMTNFGAPSVAEKYGIKFFNYTVGPPLLPNDIYPPGLNPWTSLPGSGEKVRLAWKKHDRLINLAFMTRINKERKNMGLSPVYDFMKYLTSEFVLGGYHGEIFYTPTEITETKGFFKIGNVRVHETEEENRKKINDIPREVKIFVGEDKQNGPIVFTLGSMQSLPLKKAIPEISKSVDKNDKVIIIAAASKDEMRRLPGNLPSNIMVTPYVPYEWLFDRSRLVIHHGGIGTVDYAFFSGIPQITISNMADQFFTAQRLKELGVSPGTLYYKEFSRKLLKPMIQDFKNNSDEYIRKARNVKEKFFNDDPDQRLHDAVRIVIDKMNNK